jgi:hypothetical protein
VQTNSSQPVQTKTSSVGSVLARRPQAVPNLNLSQVRTPLAASLGSC